MHQPPPPPPPGAMTPSNGNGGHASLLDSIRKAGSHPKKKLQNGSGGANPSISGDKPADYQEQLKAKIGTDVSGQREGMDEKIKREREEKIKKAKKDSLKNNPMNEVLQKRFQATRGSDGSDSGLELSSSDSESGFSNSEGKKRY